MTQHDVFHTAEWLGPPAGSTAPCHILRGRFTLAAPRKATLRVLGLGFFHCYINGHRVGDDRFLPLTTDYEPRPNYPTEETLTGHRIYVPTYDVTHLLRAGENTIAIHFGGGWYTFSGCRYGDPKAIWAICGEDADGLFLRTSSTADRIGESYVRDYDFTRSETQDFTLSTPAALADDFDDSAWPCALPAIPPDTTYAYTDCPADRVMAAVTPACLHRDGDTAVYDCGRNLTGVPVLRLTAPRGETVKLVFSEELDRGMPSEKFSHKQTAAFVADGTPRTVSPDFTWFGFRYFAVTGEAEVERVDVIHANVAQTAAFESDNDLLNWLHDTFVDTQLGNMHGGIPSDCPHIERRGYTGDGQLVCHAAMDILGARAFYRKWIDDIADCQDIHTGHVQYTAPYVRSGGGPGGWGCAIIEVPYQYYRHYGDASPLARLYPGMRRYFDYLDAHSYHDLVTSDKAGEWCLGDWCPPMQVVLPAPFVNTYFYVKSLDRMMQIAALTGHSDDIPAYAAKRQACCDAIMACYFNKWDGNFLGGLQGANAFAVDIGLGDDRTYRNLVDRYTKLGAFDTGIFGTDLVTRILFAHGDGQLAARLLCSTDVHSFAEMRARGATTIWEYWPESLRDRSHNHPMFGAVVAYLYDYLAGITDTGDAGYRTIAIAPTLVDEITRLTASRTLPAGKVTVSYTRTDTALHATVTLPDGLPAVFTLGSFTQALRPGENRISVPLSHQNQE